jgi:hypothetical protein
MVRSCWKIQFIVAASLFLGVFVTPMARAGSIIPAKELDGDYGTVQFTSSQGQVPVIFNLSNGSLTNFLTQYDFSAENLHVTVTGTSVIDLGTTDFKMISTSFPGTIDYTIVPSSQLLAFPNVITSQVTLNSSGTSTSLQPYLVNLGSAKLTLTFPSDVNLDPSWGTVTEPVFFSITPLPEPPSIIHLAWLGLLGIICYCRRYYSAARTMAA